MGRRGGFELGFWGGLDRGILIDHHKFSHTHPMEYNKWRFGVQLFWLDPYSHSEALFEIDADLLAIAEEALLRWHC
jgi:hypothetical protein